MENIIIIGGGILGASTAYHLAKEGAQVTVIDQEHQGQATAAAAGIVCPWISQRRNKAWYNLVKNGARYYPQLVEQLELEGETNTGYKQVGAISLHTDHEKLEKMIERATKRREDAPEIGEIRMLEEKEVKEHFPLVADGYKGVFISGGARVDGKALKDALKQVAIKKGARWINGNATLFVDGESKGVIVNDEKLYSNKIVVTAGAWGNEVLKPLGITFKGTHQRGQIIHLFVNHENTGDWPVIMPPNDQYLLAFDGGRVVAGATHEDNVQFDYRITAGGVEEVLSKALAIAPGLANSTILETRVGFRPFTPGFLPIIGPLPKFDGIFVANGLGASGLTAGPYLGKELAKLVLGKKLEIEINLYPVSEAIE